MASRRFTTQLLGGFAVLALVLAAIGIYGVMAFLVGQRTREIGIRMALGARPESVVALVLRQALVLATAGVVCGGIAALIMSRLLTTMLFEVQPSDPVTYGGDRPGAGRHRGPGGLVARASRRRRRSGGGPAIRVVADKKPVHSQLPIPNFQRHTSQTEYLGSWELASWGGLRLPASSKEGRQGTDKRAA